MLIEPLAKAVDADVVVPGSKSITNRALVAAALAAGESRLRGVLDADDTAAMREVIQQLGAQVRDLDTAGDVAVVGTGGTLRSGPLTLDVRMSGTTARFAAPLAARGAGAYVIDGSSEMQARPMAETARALRHLGCDVTGEALPLTVGGGFDGGWLTLAASSSSQFASGILLASAGTTTGLDLVLEGEVVSRPYIEMTCAVMRSFGAQVGQSARNRFHVAAGVGYAATDYQIEPDASAASYFLAAAAVSGGRVRIEGLGGDSLQGDVRFVEVLGEMGADVTMSSDAIEVRGSGTLNGIEVDMSDISDTAQTLAAIAPFATGRTRVTGIGFIRKKETDRVAAVVTELQRMGIDAREEDDGFVVEPGRPEPTVVQTYSDHRMAMSFAVTGLMVPGIEIADPACVNKTFPTFWDVLAKLY